MKHYLICDSVTLAVRWMESRQDDSLPVAPDGCIAMPVPPDLPAVVDSLWVDTAGTVRTKPSSPSRFHEWVGGTWVENTANRDAAAADSVRNQRDQLLAESDWTDTLSAQGRLGTPLYYRWQEYRQALRDITKQPGFPLDIVWPTPP